MASIQRHGAKWRVQVFAHGKRESKVCATKQEASQWALSREAELSGRKLPDRTFGDAMQRYAKEEAPKHRGERWELLRLNAMQKWPIARRKIAGLSARDFAEWKETRLRTRMPSTVARELNLLRSVLEIARKEWEWIRSNPTEDVAWPTLPKGRARRITADEVSAVSKAFGVADGLPSATATQRVGLMFLFALETAMRSGEMIGLQWPDVDLSARVASLPRTKNGDRREVPLSTKAIAILQALPAGEGPIFGLDSPIRDALWRKVRPKELADLHFHDTRGEAIWRLSKKLDVMQLARMIGHRDINSLMHYYRESAAEMAKLLD